jgi:hypothetical protein
MVFVDCKLMYVDIRENWRSKSRMDNAETGKIGHKTRDEDKQNKKLNTEI